MSIHVQWWEIGDTQNLHLSGKDLDLIVSEMRDKHFSPLQFGKIIGCGTGIYSKLIYRSQGITVALLKKMLDPLEIKYSAVCRDKVLIGKSKFAELVFPFELNPVFGELLANSFFDGYCDNYIFRYSNYDKQIRKEFVLAVSECVKIDLNAPKNIKLYIDSPVFLACFLKNYFKVGSFLGKACRIPVLFSDIIRMNPEFGWYFLKGAFLDEGSISGRQLWVVRGIKNKPMAQDLVELCAFFGISSEIKETKKNYFSVKICKNSYQIFTKNISTKFFNPVGKWEKVVEKTRLFEKSLAPKIKLYSDCKSILILAEEKKRLFLREVMAHFFMSESAAYARIKLLCYTGNLTKIGVGKKTSYLHVSSILPKEIVLNDMRRKYNWR